MWDHPRIRGEHSVRHSSSVSLSGSSPHTRGAQERIARGAVHRGIIPAYAGSTCRGCPSRRPSGDHPRIRGEHNVKFPRGRCLSGSSPHTRGALSDVHGRHRRARIIPAYAGSTKPPGVNFRGVSDHPRIRGEHPSSEFETYHDGGSSPHTRGALRHAPGADRRLRIIPAYAGSTTEYWCLGYAKYGSSPHTRGAL